VEHSAAKRGEVHRQRSASEALRDNRPTYQKRNTRRQRMTDETSGNRAFRELEDQNPAVARAFLAFRQHAQHPAAADYRFEIYDIGPFFNGCFSSRRMVSRSRRMLLRVALLLLGAGLVALAISSVGPAGIRFLAQHWKAFLLPIGGVCLGAGIVLLVSNLGAAPLRGVDPPNADSDQPLQELKDLAERTASRLRAAYRFQLSTVVTVGAIFIGLILWSMVMVSRKEILYASAFGSGSVAMAILTQWKWQPFERINQARRLADNADTLATGLRLRMKAISEIQDPRERAKAQWEAVEQYIDRS
jgi:hypothetical protein